MTLVRAAADRILIDRPVLVFWKQISLSTVRRRWLPAACDVKTRAALYDSDTPNPHVEVDIEG